MTKSLLTTADEKLLEGMRSLVNAIQQLAYYNHNLSIEAIEDAIYALEEARRQVKDYQLLWDDEHPVEVVYREPLPDVGTGQMDIPPRREYE